MNFNFKAIGTVRSKLTNPHNTPLQTFSSNEKGELIIYDEYKEGLEGLKLFSHIIVIYHFHRSTNELLRINPANNKMIHGIFSTRQPYRPNRIGVSVIRLENIEENILKVSNLDILNGTPILDIKPYVAQIDAFKPEKEGWLLDEYTNAQWHNRENEL